MTATRTKRILSVQPVAERGGSDLCLLRMVREPGPGRMGLPHCHARAVAVGRRVRAAGATLHVVPMRRITQSGSLRYWLGYLLLWPVAEVRLTALARRIDAGVDPLQLTALLVRLGGGPGPGHAARLARPGDRHPVRCGPAARAVAVPPLRLEGGGRLGGGGRAAPRRPGRRDPRHPRHRRSSRPPNAGRFRGRVPASPTACGWWVRPAGSTPGRASTCVLDAVGPLRSAPARCRGGHRRRAGGRQGGLRRRAGRPRRHPGRGALAGPAAPTSPTLLADLDVFVLPSTGPEPFSSVLAEAMVSGVPVAATDHGGSPEMLAPLPAGSAAVLVPPGDAPALGEAAAGLVPAGPSSAAERQGPSAHGRDPAMTLDELFEQARSASVAPGGGRRPSCPPGAAGFRWRADLRGSAPPGERVLRSRRRVENRGPSHRGHGGLARAARTGADRRRAGHARVRGGHRRRREPAVLAVGGRRAPPAPGHPALPRAGHMLVDHGAGGPATFEGSDGVEARGWSPRTSGPGTTSWVIPPSVPPGAIAGFADLNYASVGDTVHAVRLHGAPPLITSSPTGWAGTRARVPVRSGRRARPPEGCSRAARSPPGINMVSCDNWTSSACPSRSRRRSSRATTC